MSEDPKFKKEWEEHLRDHERLETVIEAEVRTKVMLDTQAAVEHIEDSISQRISPLSEELKTVHEKTDAQSTVIAAIQKETAKQTPILEAWQKGKKADRKERNRRVILDAEHKKWVKRFLWLLGAANAVVAALAAAYKFFVH